MSDRKEHDSQASTPEAKKPLAEDLAPTEQQSADLRGGPIYMHGSGGGAGKSSQ